VCSACYEIEIIDTWPADFKVEGETRFSMYDLQPDQNNTFTLTVTPTKIATYNGWSAAVNYLNSMDSSTIPGFSTQSDAIRIVDDATFDRLTSKRYTQWSFFGLGVVASIVGPYYKYLGALPSFKKTN
jgi:hypothetical protein